MPFIVTGAGFDVSLEIDSNRILIEIYLSS